MKYMKYEQRAPPIIIVLPIGLKLAASMLGMVGPLRDARVGHLAVADLSRIEVMTGA